MFSINLLLCVEFIQTEKNLHSTMFSINRHSRYIDTNGLYIYIPLCFLLIPIYFKRFLTWKIIYIPLCFLLILCKYRKSTSKWFIYIPLCFLLIAIKERHYIARDNDLHSTMFSINLWTRIRLSHHPLIYIPLCFLLITGLRQHHRLPKQIYIPLCFLLITDTVRGRHDGSPFTFHYVFY